MTMACRLRKKRQILGGGRRDLEAGMIGRIQFKAPLVLFVASICGYCLSN